MVRKITEEERASSITFLPANDAPGGDGYDEDLESVWNSWREDLDKTEKIGLIRASRVEMDEDGSAAASKTHTHLGSWPIDQYGFDALLDMLRKKFMKPGETMLVRLYAWTKDTPGSRFNRLISLTRSAQPDDERSALEGVLKIVQDNATRQVEMLQRVMAQNQPIPNSAPRSGAMEIAKDMAIILTPFVPVLAAFMNRPRPEVAAGPSLTDMIGALGTLREMAGSGGGNSDENGTVGIIKAVAPFAPLLQQALAGLANQPAQRVLAAPAVSTVQNARPPEPAQTVQPIVSPPDPNSAARSAAGESVLAQLKAQLPELCDLAAQNVDPKQAAELILDLLPDEAIPALGGLIEPENCVAKLGMLEPRVNEFQPWFGQLRLAILDQLTSD